ncbi:DNA-3-methyladenine glycosylase family protein [Bacteroidota bacterium]
MTDWIMTNHLDYDPVDAVQHLSDVDPVMAGLIHRAGPYDVEIRSMHDPFQTLMRSITFQQLSGKAANTIYGRVIDLFDGNAPPSPRQLLDMDYDRMRGAGLSNAKTLAIQDLASKTLDGTVPTLDAMRSMGDEEIINRLVNVRGIGRWTVQMLLIFRLGRADVFPVHDLGVRKGYTQIHGLDELIAPKKLEAAGEIWRPYRSVASWYLWRAVDADLM